MTTSKKREKDLKTLDLKSGASNEDIKLAYRRMAKKTHPDLNKDDPKASEKFLEVKTAYDDLQKPEGQEKATEVGHPRERDVWREFDSFFRDFFFQDNPFRFEEQPQNDIPLSQPEPFVDLKALIRNRKKSQFF